MSLCGMRMRKMDQWEAEFLDCGSNYPMGPQRHEQFTYSSEIYQALIVPASFDGSGRPSTWRLEVNFGTISIDGLRLSWSPYATARDAMEACGPCIKAYAEKLIRTSPPDGSSTQGLAAADEASKRRAKVAELEAELNRLRYGAGGV